MIACISRNERAVCLFNELRKLDPAYVDVGVVRPSRVARAIGRLSSLRIDLNQARCDAFFSPALRREHERQCADLLHSIERPEAVLYWGGINSPVDRYDKYLGYFTITDGPYDPSDCAYLPPWKPVRWRREYFFRQRSIFQSANHVFTLSEWARRKIIAIHQMPPERVTAVGWGPMHRLDHPSLTLDGPPYFLSIGNQWYRKGMDLVAKAGEIVHRKFPEIQTIIAGAPVGFEVPPAAGIVQMPHFVPGTISQHLIRNAKAFIVASRFDASPHTIYEALQSGTPVIGSDVCGIPEAIRAPRGGLVVRVGDADAIAEAMLKILDQDALTQRENAYQVYVESGGWRQCAKLVKAVVDYTLSGGLQSSPKVGVPKMQ
jgi:glycosyltransferase involved in cell wall biosynthesis